MDGDVRPLYRRGGADSRTALRRVVEMRTEASARAARGGNEGREYTVRAFAGAVVRRLSASALPCAWTEQVAVCVDRERRTLGDVTDAVANAAPA